MTGDVAVADGFLATPVAEAVLPGATPAFPVVAPPEALLGAAEVPFVSFAGGFFVTESLLATFGTESLLPTDFGVAGF